MSPTSLTMIPVDLIDPHPHNPRRDLGDLTELADSIRAHGVRQNLLLVPQTSDATQIATGRCERYTVVIGHRRLAAAKLAGLDAVPATVDDTLTEAQQLELMLLENIQRADLSPVEEAEGYQGLLDLGVKVRAIAKATGRAEKTVTARLRLLHLPAAARDAVHAGQATLEDAAQLEQLVDGTAGEKLDARQLKKVLAALGTSNFRWEIQHARNTVEARKAAAAIDARLAELGIPRIKHDGFGTPDGYRWFRYVGSLAALDGIDLEGVVYSKQGSSYQLLRPADATEQRRDDAAARARAYDEQIKAEGETARDLRDVFVRGFVTRKKLTRDQIDTIVAAVAPYAVSSSLDSYNLLPEWLGEQQHYRSKAEIREMVARHLPDAHPAALMLLALHLATWHSPWQFAASRGRLATLYRLLEALGYVMSDVERARVFPPPEDDDEGDGDGDVPDADGEPGPDGDDVLCTVCGHPADDHDLDDPACWYADTFGPDGCDCTGLVQAEAGV